jgi:tetratricopeptide (TPR) repeat protein
MHFFLPFRWAERRYGRALAFAVVCAFLAIGTLAQQAPDSSARGRILLVLPFDNKTGEPSLEWIREAAPEILGSRFGSAGFTPLSRADRLYALDHLGLPQAFQPSHASSLKIAQTLDADSIIVGSYSMDAGRFEAQAQIISVPHLRMSEPITASGDLHDLVAVFDSLAWKLTRQMDPTFNIAQETFVAAGANVNLAAFEQYIRGITEQDQSERIRHLNEAVKLNPDFSQAWMALARADYAAQQYERAAAAFAKVKGNDADTLEAGFYRGLALMFSGNYAQAETSFAEVARVLPLAPVLNNEGVAISRQGHDATALFRQAEGADPNAPDYHFNLAVSLDRHGDHAGAQAELAQCLKQRPNDSEAQEMQAAWKTPSTAAPVEPLERIVRGFDEVAFRQAAVVLDQVDAARLTALAPAQRAQSLATQAREYLSRGLLLESERLYQQAIAADDRCEAAHEGLAEVRERTGDIDGARKEAEAAIQLGPTVGAYLVMARVDMAAKRLDDAAHDAREALKLSPGNKAATEVLREVNARQGAVSPQAP